MYDRTSKVIHNVTQCALRTQGQNGHLTVDTLLE